MATSKDALVKSQFGGMGVVQQYGVKITGYVGLSSAASATIANYTVSPFTHDMVILAAYMDITTVDAQDADLDIGIADDADGTNQEDNLFDSPANTAAVVLEGLAVQTIAGKALPIWKAAGASTNSYITAEQNGNVDASSLVYNLLLVCARKSDFD